MLLIWFSYLEVIAYRYICFYFSLWELECVPIVNTYPIYVSKRGKPLNKFYQSEISVRTKSGVFRPLSSTYSLYFLFSYILHKFQNRSHDSYNKAFKFLVVKVMDWMSFSGIERQRSSTYKSMLCGCIFMRDWEKLLPFCFIKYMLLLCLITKCAILRK